MQHHSTICKEHQQQQHAMASGLSIRHSLKQSRQFGVVTGRHAATDHAIYTRRDFLRSKLHVAVCYCNTNTCMLCDRAATLADSPHKTHNQAVQTTHQNQSSTAALNQLPSVTRTPPKPQHCKSNHADKPHHQLLVFSVDHWLGGAPHTVSTLHTAQPPAHSHDHAQGQASCNLQDTLSQLGAMHIVFEVVPATTSW